MKRPQRTEGAPMDCVLPQRELDSPRSRVSRCTTWHFTEAICIRLVAESCLILFALLGLGPRVLVMSGAFETRHLRDGVRRLYRYRAVEGAAKGASRRSIIPVL